MKNLFFNQCQHKLKFLLIHFITSRVIISHIHTGVQENKFRSWYFDLSLELKHKMRFFRIIMICFDTNLIHILRPRKKAHRLMCSFIMTFRKDPEIPFCNRIFGSFDYSITTSYSYITLCLFVFAIKYALQLFLISFYYFKKYFPY